MRCIDAQFAENILAVGGDGVDAREALGSNLLGGFPQGDGFDNLRLRLREDAVGFFLFLLLGDDGLEGSLAEVARVATDGCQRLANLTQRAVLEHHTELMGGIDHAADELRREVVADEYPIGQAEAFGNDEQLVLVGKVEQGVVEQYYGALVLLEQVYKSGSVESAIDGSSLDVLKQALQRKARQFLIVGNDIIPHNVGFTSAKKLFSKRPQITQI